MTEATTDPTVKAAVLRATTGFVPETQGRGSIRHKFSGSLLLLMALSASIFFVRSYSTWPIFSLPDSMPVPMSSACASLSGSRARLLRQVVLEDTLIVVGSILAFAIGRIVSGMLVRWASNHNWRITIDLHTSLPTAVLGVSLMLLSLLSFSILPTFISVRRSAAHAAGSRARIAGIAKPAASGGGEPVARHAGQSFPFAFHHVGLLLHYSRALGNCRCGHGPRACPLSPR